MFDKLIESNSVDAEFKPRRKFFMVSSVVVGIAFLSAVVISLYAQDIDLGTNDFELAELLAPVIADAPEPEPPREQLRQANDQNQQTELPNRPELISRVAENVIPPDSISTVQNTVPEIPDTGRFTNDPGRPASEGIGPVGDGRGTSSSAGPVEAAPAEVAKVVEPPPIIEKPAAPRPPVSLGPVNGIAKYLPKPAYPPPAKAVRAGGPVTVQVTIDEEGNVISAKVLDGHPLLRRVSQDAAMKARFTPTTLSKIPVKVTGVITYNFQP